MGSGSAGRRHAKALRRALPRSEVSVVRRVSSSAVDRELASIGCRIVPTVDEALDGGCDLAVVASPAPFHAEHARRLAGAGAVVMVEKPLAATLADAASMVGVRGIESVGYHLRLHRSVELARDLIASGRIGEVVGFDLTVGQHLDQWRPGSDVRRTVTARWELGGGVLLELSHELDAVAVLLGVGHAAIEVDSAELRTDGAPTDGIVETSADLQLVVNGVRGRVHLDMVNRVPERVWRIRGDQSEVVVDLISGEVRLGSGVRWTAPTDERDRAEGRLIDNLVGVWRGNAVPACTVAEGRDVLAVVEAARRAGGTRP